MAIFFQIGKISTYPLRTAQRNLNKILLGANDNDDIESITNTPKASLLELDKLLDNTKGNLTVTTSQARTSTASATAVVEKKIITEQGATDAMQWKTEKYNKSSGPSYSNNSNAVYTAPITNSKQDTQLSISLLDNGRLDDDNCASKLTLKNSSALKNDVKLTQYNEFNSFHHQSHELQQQQQQRQQQSQHQSQQKTLEQDSSSVQKQQACQSSQTHGETIIDAAATYNNNDVPIIMNNNLKQQKDIRNALMPELNVSDFSPLPNIMSQQDNASGEYSAISIIFQRKTNFY